MVPQQVQKKFKEREKKVLGLLMEELPSYVAIGVFGSYARGNYKATSDIDFCVITEEKPDRYLAGELRCTAEEWGADIVFIKPLHFESANSVFLREIKRDFRRLL